MAAVDPAARDAAQASQTIPPFRIEDEARKLPDTNLVVNGLSGARRAPAWLPRQDPR